MWYISNDNCCDPRYNLAFEEYVFQNILLGECIVLLWQNEPSVIIGRFQNTFEEINQTFIENNHIHVVRRMTGGGAVYHDMGNLNFSFIGSIDSESFDFSQFSLPVVRTLEKYGVQAEASGRNDITIKGRKFSGTAQYCKNGRVLFHGTLLYSAQLDDIRASLNVRAEKIQSKGVKSVRNRVTNISEHLSIPIPLREFRNELLKTFFAPESVQEYVLSKSDQNKIKRLALDKYSNWDWNYGNSPDCQIVRYGHHACGNLRVAFDIENAHIKTCKINGDFFSNHDIAELEQLLQGRPHLRSDILHTLQHISLSEYVSNINVNDFVDMLF